METLTKDEAKRIYCALMFGMPTSSDKKLDVAVQKIKSMFNG